MRRLDPVIWSKGTLLSPQYLQQQDRYIEDTARFELSALSFRPWGFQKLRVDREALAGGVLALTAASGIFADGLVFELPDSDAAPEPKPVAPCFGLAGAAVDFYLAVPQQRDRAPNLGPSSAGVRFRPSLETVRDENSGVAEQCVQLARKNLMLVGGEESREGLSTLRVARVIRTAAGGYELDDAFVPPLIDIGASSFLTSIARRLVEILAARSTTLSAGLPWKNQALGEFTAADIPNFWLLYTINAWLPVFRHIFESRMGHPEALFAAMTALAASLTTFSTDVRPSDLPAYDHENLGPCFRDLDEKLRFLLEHAVPRSFVSMPLKEIRASIYAASIDDERCLASKRMYLAVRSPAGAAEIVEKAPRLVKVCSADHVDHLVRQALPGVVLTHVPLPPGTVQVKSDFEYFSLDQNGLAWESVRRARNLAAYVPSELPNPELELVILLPPPA